MLRYFFTASLAAMIFSPTVVAAQQKSPIIGTWTLTAIVQTDKDGKPQAIFGSNPKGILVFDASGQCVQIISSSDTPKFAVNNRLGGTPTENAAAIRGTTANFGTCTFDDAKKTVTQRYVGSVFPNQVGTDSPRTYSMTGDELTLTNPSTGSGLVSKTVWRRAK